MTSLQEKKNSFKIKHAFLILIFLTFDCLFLHISNIPLLDYVMHTDMRDIWFWLVSL